MRSQSLLKRIMTALFLCACGTSLVHGQAKYTASRSGDLQVGVSFVDGSSDYGHSLKGAGFFGTFDFTNHFGGEIDFHQASSREDEYERTYEVGGRYYRSYGRVSPYVKLMYGRGVFNFPFNEANLAYNLFAGAGGADVRVTRYLNVRGEFEYQHWLGFPPHGLDPEFVTVGVAFHFPGGLKRGRHY